MTALHKTYSILVLFVMASLLSGCENGSNNSELGDSNSQTEAVCVEPENPYGDDGGHDAGFNWANENGGDCDGNSDSFNEGCEEYHRQRNQYEECVANKK